MSGRPSAATERGIELIRAGMPLRTAAAEVGVANSTLVRACQRAGLTLTRGRKPAEAGEARGATQALPVG